jgi:hypothetical protein
MIKTKAGRKTGRERFLTERGDLYAAESSDGVWIKIGFTKRLAARIRQINNDYDEVKFTLLGSTNSTYRTEQQLHACMQSLHTIQISEGKEFYPAGPAVRHIVEGILAKPTLDPLELEEFRVFRAWCRKQSELPENIRAARTAHAEQIAQNQAASARYYARIAARVAAREAARAQS